MIITMIGLIFFLTPRYTKHRVALIKKWEEMYCNF